MSKEITPNLSKYLTSQIVTRRYPGRPKTLPEGKVTVSKTISITPDNKALIDKHHGSLTEAISDLVRITGHAETLTQYNKLINQLKKLK